MDRDRDLELNPSEAVHISGMDLEITGQVQDVLRVLTQAISLIKIFSFDHSSALKFINELEEKLTAFLNKHTRLEIGIKEYAFLYADEEIYREENPLKSLPFLFFKDGVSKLIFLKGMDRNELLGFLEVVKTVSLLPPDEGDIVSALWEMDFLNIRYIALDNFLESKIGKGRDAIDTEFSKEAMSEGKVDLDEEDQEALTKTSEKKNEDAHTWKRETDLFLPGSGPSLDNQERVSLDSILHTERKISEEEELINLMVELLYLEERIEPFKYNLNFLGQYNQNLILGAALTKSTLLMKYLKELALTLQEHSEEKPKLIQDFFLFQQQTVPLDVIKTHFKEGKIPELNDLFSFLTMIGPRGTTLIGDLLKETLDLNFRKKAFEYLRTIGEENLQSLVDMAQDGNPDLTREIIKILAAMETPEAISKFNIFLDYTTKSTKMDAIHVLSSLPGEEANRILFKFIEDQDDDIRILTMNKVKFMGNEETLQYFTGISSDRSLIKKPKEEKRAALNFLGRSKNGEAIEILSTIVHKTSLLPNKKLQETRLIAVSALEIAATPEAVAALKSCQKVRGKTVKRACRLALRRMGFQSGDS
jgi:hypothetical protein